MNLDLDGILNVTAIEKKSGLSRHITIARALEAKSEADIAAARKRLEALFATRREENDFDAEQDLLGQAGTDAELPDAPLELTARSADHEDWNAVEEEGQQMIERSRRLLETIHEEDREEVIDLNQAIEAEIRERNDTALKQAIHDLGELMFFVEGRA
jgi:molecular chaperone DnaK (HSP70)